MASNERVGWALSVLKHLPSKNPVTAETTAFYALGLRDVSDADLTNAIGLAASRCTFLPTPAELRGFLPALRKTPPNVEGVRQRLRHLAACNGDEMPRVENVRRVLGDAIADAYGHIGVHRLEAYVFGGSGVGADIAAREFADLLTDAQDHGADLRLAPVAEVLRLNAAPTLALPSRASSGAIVYDDPSPRGLVRGLKRIGA